MFVTSLFLARLFISFENLFKEPVLVSLLFSIILLVWSFCFPFHWFMLWSLLFLFLCFFSSFSDFSVSFCTPASCHSPCYLQPSSLSLRNPDDSQGADYYSNLSILETVPSRPELCPSPLVHILTALLKISWNFNHTPIPKGIHVFLLRSVFPCHLHFCNGTTRLPLTWAWHLGSTFGLFSFDGCIYKWPHGCKATGIQLPQCCRQAG